MRRYGHLLLAAVALALAAAALAACGGSSSSSSASSADQKQITDAIVTSGSTDNPANCTELETQRFVEQNEGETGQAALDACRKGKNHADSIVVTNVNVDGGSATADAAITGSAFGGQKVQISLVKDGGQWKLDHLDKFIDFDRGAFDSALKQSLSTSTNSTTAAQTTCITETLAKLSDEKIESIVLSGDENELVSIITPCFTGSNAPG
jgi:predicted flavoprotein YhiN